MPRRPGSSSEYVFQAAAGARAQRIDLSWDGHAWTFSVAGKKLILDWDNDEHVQ